MYRLIKTNDRTRYEAIWSDFDFEDLLEKYISSEAADYYRDRIEGLVEEYENTICELEERIDKFEDKLDEQKTRKRF